jgi:hypothetical protein
MLLVYFTLSSFVLASNTFALALSGPFFTPTTTLLDLDRLPKSFYN